MCLSVPYEWWGPSDAWRECCKQHLFLHGLLDVKHFFFNYTQMTIIAEIFLNTFLQQKLSLKILCTSMVKRTHPQSLCAHRAGAHRLLPLDGCIKNFVTLNFKSLNIVVVLHWSIFVVLLHWSIMHVSSVSLFH